jgi:hypothetical protein
LVKVSIENSLKKRNKLDKICLKQGSKRNFIENNNKSFVFAKWGKNDISLKRTFFPLQTVFGIISLTIFEFFFQQLPDNLQNVETEQNVPNLGTEKESLPSLKIVKLLKMKWLIISSKGTYGVWACYLWRFPGYFRLG